MTDAWHLAHFNIARTRTRPDDPAMRGFFDGIASMNALAERSEGFLWRMQDDDGASDPRIAGDDRFVVNLSVWRSIEALKRYSYTTEHGAFVRRRREWFERMPDASYVLWWIPAGHRPDLREGLDRLDMLRRHGPAADAFSFSHPFPIPASTVDG